MTPRRCGSVSRWTGMGKANASWRSVRPRRCGIAMALILCPSGGCSRAILRASVLPRPCFPRIKHRLLRRLSLILCARWSLETTFEEGRAHIGLETQRQWSDLAIERTTPLLFGLYSLVTLFGQALYPDGELPLKQAAWYHKQAATFGDVLAVVRQHLWGNFTFPTSPTDPDVVLVPRSTLSRLAYAVCY